MQSVIFINTFIPYVRRTFKHCYCRYLGKAVIVKNAIVSVETVSQDWDNKSVFLKLVLFSSRSTYFVHTVQYTSCACVQSLSGLTQDISLVARDSVSIQKDCGEDNLCVPDLRLSYSRYSLYMFCSLTFLGLILLNSNGAFREVN